MGLSPGYINELRQKSNNNNYLNYITIYTRVGNKGWEMKTLVTLAGSEEWMKKSRNMWIGEGLLAWGCGKLCHKAVCDRLILPHDSQLPLAGNQPLPFTVRMINFKGIIDNTTVKRSKWKPCKHLDKTSLFLLIVWKSLPLHDSPDIWHDMWRAKW